jgi:hypothetical protein
MKVLATAALIPAFAGFLCAQESSRTTETTTTATSYNGTLMDAGCVSKRTVTKETTSDPADGSTTTKTTTTRETMDCPVTTTTTSFVLMTPEGRYVHFDEPSNTRIVEVVKSNKDWTRARFHCEV